MSAAHVERRRVLLAAEDPERSEVRALFGSEPLRSWEVVEADSLERARFVLQLDPCDVLLLGSSLYRAGGPADLAWLAGKPPSAERAAPVLLLADSDPDTILGALHQGVHYWLPRETALRHPQVLAAMLDQVAEFGDLLRQGEQTAEALQDSRRQVSRLVSLLWEAVPGEGRARWFNQRHMLERLEEEVARAQRHGGPLTVILAEVEGAPQEQASAGEARQLTTWTADRIGPIKRRSDVAGQYGLQGFMLLLPLTTAEGAAACCRRLREALEKPEGGPGPLGPVQVFFGIASYGPEAASVKALLRRAEEQLERARAGSPEGMQKPEG